MRHDNIKAEDLSCTKTVENLLNTMGLSEEDLTKSMFNDRMKANKLMDTMISSLTTDTYGNNHENENSNEGTCTRTAKETIMAIQNAKFKDR